MGFVAAVSCLPHAVENVSLKEQMYQLESQCCAQTEQIADMQTQTAASLCRLQEELTHSSTRADMLRTYTYIHTYIDMIIRHAVCHRLLYRREC